MEYLLILFVIAVVLSPLAWFKSSPSQVRVTAFRKKALGSGLVVQLVPAIDAEETVKRPEAVRYFLPYPHSRAAELHSKLGDWTLMKNRRRGWESPWPQWNWFRGEAAESCGGMIAEVISALPEVAYGIRAERSGVAVFLEESGEVAVVDQIARALQLFHDL